MRILKLSILLVVLSGMLFGLTLPSFNTGVRLSAMYPISSLEDVLGTIPAFTFYGNMIIPLDIFNIKLEGDLIAKDYFAVLAVKGGVYISYHYAVNNFHFNVAGGIEAIKDPINTPPTFNIPVSLDISYSFEVIPWH